MRTLARLAAVALVAGGLLSSSFAPAMAFHSYAVAFETSVGTYSAIGLARTDGYVTVPGSANCSVPYQANVFKSEWALLNGGATDWVEFGTGYNCQGYRYHYRGYGLNNVWYSQIVTPVSAGDPSNSMDLILHGTAWSSRFNGADAVIYDPGTVRNAVFLEAGLESYSSSLTVPAHQYQSLQYATRGGSWTNWSGRDSSGSSNPVCGGWDSDIQWHARENVAPAC